MKRLLIKVFSDYICPFCYLLLPKLDRLREELPVDVSWEPVLSHPEIPEQGLPLAELMEREERIRDAVESARILARREGVELRFPERISSSKMAVWMAECARRNGKFESYHRRVYRAYFQEGRDIGDDRTIPEIVKSLGIPKKAVAAFCKDREGYARVVTDRLRECRDLGITQVPTLVAGGTKIEGSWPYPLLHRAVEELLRKSA